MLAHLLFTLQHRAGVRPNTSSYDLAESCVFIKQSLLPIFCHLNKKILLTIKFFYLNPPYPEVTGSICRVPSIQFSQAP